jgi:flagellar biosynthesis protein FlhF
MRIRRYVAPALDEAVDRVKKELGRDAIILEVRRIRAPGLWGWFKRRRIEVTAAVTQPTISSPPAAVIKGPPARPVPPQKSNFKPARLSLTPEEDIVPEQLRLPYALARQQTDLLIARGVRPELARQLVKQAMEALATNELTDGEAVRRSVSKVIASRFIPQNQKDCSGRIVAFVGPTGVGKTTTIAKLAAVYKLQQGKEVTLITTDTYRIAAAEQLRRYAEILHLPLEVVYTTTDLLTALDRHQLTGIVLVDTAGRSPQQEMYLAELRALLARIPNIHTILVVSATTKAEDLDLIYERFQVFSPNEVILTKVDETQSVGTLLNLVERMRVPVGFVCNGQNVPDDLMVANPQLLADLVLGGANYG